MLRAKKRIKTAQTAQKQESKPKATTQTNNTPTDTEKRGKVEYENASLNYEALKNLENSTVRSVLELVNKVILIDGIPFGKATYKDANGNNKPIKLTTGRRNDFLRTIESHAIIKFIGIKCHIVKVFNVSHHEKLDEFLIQQQIEKMKHT